MGSLQTAHDAVLDDAGGEGVGELEEVHGVDEDLCLLLVGEPLGDIVDAGVEDAWVDDVARVDGGDDGGSGGGGPEEMAGGLVVAMGVRMLVRHAFGERATTTVWALVQRSCDLYVRFPLAE